MNMNKEIATREVRSLEARDFELALGEGDVADEVTVEIEGQKYKLVPVEPEEGMEGDEYLSITVFPILPWPSILEFVIALTSNSSVSNISEYVATIWLSTLPLVSYERFLTSCTSKRVFAEVASE